MKKWISIAKIIWSLTVVILLIVISFMVFELKADIDEVYRKILVLRTTSLIIEKLK